MAVNLATAYVEIIPSAKGIGKAVNQELTGVAKQASKTGDTIGSKLSGAIGKTMKAGALGAGAAVGGVLATSIAKGFKRLNALDQAEAKFKGLGVTGGQLSSAMDSVSKSVKGTSFGLDEAAGSAAKLNAVGVETGKSLDRAMTLTADIAAQAGTSMDDVSSIMAKIAGAGKVTGETLAQLDDRATGAGAAIADHLGVSIDEMREKVSAGEVSFEDFQVAMEKHLGGAAQKTGETFSGAFANMGAAAGRLGANLLAPAFTAAPALFGSIGKAFDSMGESIKPAMERLGTALTPAMERLGVVIEEKIAPAVGKAAGALADFVAGLVVDGLNSDIWGRIGESFGKIASAAGQAWPSVSSLLQSLGSVAANLSVATWEAFANILNAVAPLISNVVVPALTAVSDVAAKNPGAVQALATAFLGFRAVKGVVGPVTDTAKALKGAVDKAKDYGSALKTSFEYAGQAAPNAGKLGKAWIVLKGNATAGLQSLAKSNPIIGGMSKGLKALWGVMAANPIITVVAAIAAVTAGLTWFFTKTEAGKKAWAALTEFMTSAWEKVASGLSAGWQWIQSSVFEPIKTAFSGLKALFVDGDYTSALSDAFGLEEDSAVVDWMFRIRDTFITVKDAVVTAFGFMKDKWQEFTTGFGQFYNTWVQPVVTVATTAFGVVRDIVGGVVSAFGTFASAVGAALSTAFEFVSSVVGWIVEKFQSIATALQPVTDAIGVVFSRVGEIVRQIWEGSIKAVFDAIRTAADLVGIAFQTFGQVVRAAFSAVGQIIRSVYDNLIKPPLMLFRQLAGLLADVLTGNFSNIGNRFRQLGGTLKNVVLGPIRFAFDQFKAAAGFAKDAFNAFKDGVGRAKDRIVSYLSDMVRKFTGVPGKIKSAFASAGSWLSDAGRNLIQGFANGIRSATGWIVDAIKGLVPSALHRFLPFMDGGFFFLNGSEDHRAMIAGAGNGRTPFRVWAEPETGGEAYIPLAKGKRKRSTQILATVADRFGLTLSGRDGTPLPPAARRMVAAKGQAFANGGITSATDLLRFARGENVNGKRAARSLQGAPYVWGGSNWGDCSGAMSQLAAAVTNSGNWFTRKFATGSQSGWLAQHGFKSGLGSGPRFATGHFNGGSYGGHTSGTIFFGGGKRVNVEMGGGAGGQGKIGGAAAGADHSQYTNRFHYPLKATSTAPQAKAVASGKVASTSAQGITLTGGEQIDWGEANQLFSDVQKDRQLAKKLARWRKGAFDQGGVARGLGFMPKATIKPERVLNPSNTKSFDKLPPALADVANKLGMSAEAQGMAARAMNNIGALGQSFTFKDALTIGEKLGMDGFTGLFKDSVSAWDGMRTSFAAQVDAADGVKQAEKNLQTARREYAQAMVEDTSLTTKQKRKLEDAKSALAKAKKPNKKGKVNADKVAKAELRLSRVREDIAEEQKKAGKKQGETAKEAAKNLLKAESDLADARETVTAAAKAAGHAEIAFAIEVIDTVLKVVDKITGAVMSARAAAAAGIASMMTSIRDLTGMTDSLRDGLAMARVESAQAMVKVQAAYRNVRLAQFDGARAQLEAAKTVAEAQKKFNAQRRVDMGVAMQDYKDLSLAFDRWRWTLRAGIDESLADMAAWSDESHALWAELQAAQIGRQIAEKQAQLDVLKSIFEHQKAVLDLQQATTSLSIAAEKFAVMTGKAFGYDTVQATVGTRYTELLSEKAKLQADQASLKTWINPVNWFTSMPAAGKRIKQIDEELARIAAMPEFKAFTPEQLAEAKRVQAAAGAMGFFGAGDRVESMVQNSALGNAARALEEAKFQQELVDARHASTVAQQNLKEKQAEVDQAQRLQPLEALIDQLRARQESEKTWAEYWREDDENVRKALADLAAFQSDSAAAMTRISTDSSSVTIAIPAGKTAFSLDEVKSLVAQMNAEQDKLDLRVTRLERPAVSGADVARARKVIV